MFSYTDDAIVTSSPTGRHLRTVIRRPAAIGPLDWNEHADQVCKVLNELDRASKCKEMRLALSYAEGPAGLQAYGRVKRIDTPYEEFCRSEGLDPGELRSTVVTATSAAERIAELEKQLDDATTKLAAAQMLLEKPIEVSNDLARLLQKGRPGDRFIANRTFKRVE